MVYPVPVTDYLTIDVKKSGNYHIVIYDIKGTVVDDRHISGTTKIDMTQLPYGFYLVQAGNDANDRGFIKRIVKQ